MEFYDRIDELETLARIEKQSADPRSVVESLAIERYVLT